MTTSDSEKLERLRDVEALMRKVAADIRPAPRRPDFSGVSSFERDNAETLRQLAERLNLLATDIGNYLLRHYAPGRPPAPRK